MQTRSESVWFSGARLAWMVFAAGAVLIAAVLFAVARLVDPAPPTSVRMATGTDGGAYAAAGDLLRTSLAGYGVELELVPTSGSVENLQLLKDRTVDVAIIQGGVGVDDETATAGLEALGALFYEPLWVFTRAGIEIDDLGRLAGARVAIGPEGSGIRALSLLLLEENGVGPEDARFSPLTGAAAADALRRGDIDAAIYVTSPDRPYIRDLLVDDRFAVLSFERATAYERRHRYLSSLLLPRGVIDMQRDVPSQDVTLVAPAAALVVRGDLHPAIESLLLQGAFDNFRGGGVLTAPGAFPNRDLVAFPLSDQAKRFFERGGPSFLRRYLPFWAANLVDRLWVLAIPMLTLIYPLAKAAPPVYRWQVRRRIIRWYRDLRRLETEGRHADSVIERARVRGELKGILDEVGQIKVPLPYNDDVYRLRGHIRLVDQIIAETESGAPVLD